MLADARRVWIGLDGSFYCSAIAVMVSLECMCRWGGRGGGTVELPWIGGPKGERASASKFLVRSVLSLVQGGGQGRRAEGRLVRGAI